MVVYVLFYSNIINQVTVLVVSGADEQALALPLAELQGEEAINDLSGPDPEGSPDQWVDPGFSNTYDCRGGPGTERSIETLGWRHAGFSPWRKGTAA